MTNTWQKYQARLAALLEDEPVPAPNWGRGRPALRPHSPTPPGDDGRDEPVATVVRLPGVRRPECAAPPLAAHVVAFRTWYAHHGIYVGDGKVVHYRGLSRGWRAGPVEEVCLAEFARGCPIRVRPHIGARFDRDTVVARARSRLGEDAYHILSNNCEHFCEWCVHGINRSHQIEYLLARPRRTLLALMHFLQVISLPPFVETPQASPHRARALRTARQ